MRSYARVRTGIALTVAVMLIAACGGGGTNDPGTTQAGVTTTVVTTPTNPTTPTPTGGTGPGGISQTCLNAGQAFANAFAGYASVTAGMTADQARDIADRLENVGADLPSDLRSDFEEFAGLLAAFYRGVADLGGFTPGAVPSQAQLEQFAELAEELEEQGFTEVAERVGTWFETNCG